MYQTLTKFVLSTLFSPSFTSLYRGTPVLSNALSSGLPLQSGVSDLSLGPGESGRDTGPVYRRGPTRRLVLIIVMVQKENPRDPLYYVHLHHQYHQTSKDFVTGR